MSFPRTLPRAIPLWDARLSSRPKHGQATPNIDDA